MPNYPADSNDTVVYNGVDLYVPKDCSVTVFEDSRVFLFGEYYLNGQPILTGASAPSGVEVSVSTVQPVDPGIKLWFDTSAGYGELKVFLAGSWIPVEDPADALAANEVQISSAQPVGTNYELWVDTTTSPEALKAKIAGSWKNLTIDEVSIGGTEPVDPNIELWVDTATASPTPMTPYLAAGNALGIVAVGTFPGQLLNLAASSSTQVTNNLPVTLATGRRYRVNLYVRAISYQPATGGGANWFLRDGTTNIAGTNPLNTVANNSFNSYNYSWVLDGDGTTKNLNILYQPNAISSFYGDGQSYFNVEDLGPNTRPAYPLTSPPPDGYVSPGNALGIVAIGSLVSGAPYVINSGQTIQMTTTVPCTLTAGRRYRATIIIRAVKTVNTESYMQVSLRDGTTNLYTAYPLHFVPPGSGTGFNSFNYSWVLDGDGTTKNLNVTIASPTTNISLYTETGGSFYIEDMGPNVRPALPLTAPPPDGYVSPGNALGAVAIGSFSAASFSVSANTTISNALTTTLLAGRRYRLVCLLRAANILTLPSTFTLNVSRDGTSTPASGTTVFTVWHGANQAWTGSILGEILIDGDGLSHTFYAWMGNIINTFTIFTDSGSCFYIEDVGPNVNPALPVPATPPAWTPVSAFLNGWTTNSAGGLGPVRYRKVGDIVSIEGIVVPGTLQQPAFNLPVGFRPPVDRYFSTIAGTAANTTIVGGNGNVIVWMGSGSCHIQCSFSTTP